MNPHRTLSTAEVEDCRVLEPSRRNRLLLRLLSATPLRVSELCSLRWRDLQWRQAEGPLIIVGKSGQLRFVPLSVLIWQEIQDSRGHAGDLEPLFRSRKGGPLSPRQVDRIVRAAAKRAGIGGPVSPSVLRHARPT
jgi:integrase